MKYCDYGLVCDTFQATKTGINYITYDKDEDDNKEK